MKSIINKIKTNSQNNLKDNNFLFVAFENRLIIRIETIFKKHSIAINKSILNKNIEENLINSLNSINEDIMEKYVILLEKYENILQNYVKENTDTKIIKQATLNFIEKISEKNKNVVPKTILQNFLEYIKSFIFIYDNKSLNDEVINRINIDTNEIIKEFNKNNYNFVIESINEIIKNIIKNL